ncbi:MAG: zinc ribbon domain-containing protein [Candidatus Asgardarchaeia archaeon]
MRKEYLFTIMMVLMLGSFLTIPLSHSTSSRPDWLKEGVWFEYSVEYGTSNYKIEGTDTFTIKEISGDYATILRELRIFDPETGEVSEVEDSITVNLNDRKTSDGEYIELWIPQNSSLGDEVWILDRKVNLSDVLDIDTPWGRRECFVATLVGISGEVGVYFYDKSTGILMKLNYFESNLFYSWSLEDTNVNIGIKTTFIYYGAAIALFIVLGIVFIKFFGKKGKKEEHEEPYFYYIPPTPKEVEEYKYCPLCGYPLPEGAKFCPNCGEIIKKDDEDEVLF